MTYIQHYYKEKNINYCAHKQYEHKITQLKKLLTNALDHKNDMITLVVSKAEYIYISKIEKKIECSSIF